MWKCVAMTVLLGACGVVQESTETGPDLRVSLEEQNGGGFIDSTTGSGGELRAGDDGQYHLAVTALAMEGLQKFKSDFKNIPVTSVSVTITVDGEDIPASPIQKDGDLGISYTRKDPVVLTSSATGKLMHVTGTAVDADDVHSNVVDFTCMLTPMF